MANDTKHTRCLFKAKISDLLSMNSDEVVGLIINSFHGIVLTSTTEAWMSEIEIMQRVLLPWKDDDNESDRLCKEKRIGED